MMRMLCLALILIFQVELAHATGNEPTVSVVGVAQKEIVPDEIRWTLQVKTEGPTAKEVSQTHVTEVADVLSLLVELGQEEKSVATSNMQLGEKWIYRNNNREKSGYYASTVIRFISNDFTAYVDYWTRLTALNNVSISGASFGVSNRGEIEDAVKVDAIVVARKKAQKFAEALGAEVGSPLRIEETVDEPNFPKGYARAALMESDSGGQPISPGTERIQAQVKVVFNLR